MAETWLKIRKFSYRVLLARARSKDKYRPILVKRRREFYHAMWAAGAKRVGAEFEVIDGDFCHVWRDNRSTYFSECQTVLDGGVSQGIADNKVVAHRVLGDIKGYCAPGHIKFSLNDLDRVAKFMEDAKGPIVIKPVKGTGAGIGVATNIDNRVKLQKAALNASLFGGTMVAEHQNIGASYRLMFLDGQLLHTVRRDPPLMIGNGHSTIAELVEVENLRRINSEIPVAFSPLELDEEMRVTLQQQGLTPESVPDENKSIMVKLVSNQNSAGENVEDGPVCDEIKQLGADIATRLRLRFMGLDLMTSDLGLSLPEAGGVITDVNGSPGLHHHFLCDPNGADPEADIGKIVIDPIIEKALINGPIHYGEAEH